MMRGCVVVIKYKRRSIVPDVMQMGRQPQNKSAGKRGGE